MEEYKINNKIFKLNVFERVRDYNDAYLIGYLSGDGAFCAGIENKRSSRLAISSQDYDIISSFSGYYCPDCSIKSLIPVNNKNKKIKSTKECHSFVFSSKFSKAFKAHGILSLKKDRNILCISKDNMKAFLRGLFDSDGHISWGRRKDRNRLWSNFVITHQSILLLTKVQSYLCEFGISSYINPRKDENCMDLKLSKREDVVKIYDILYSFDIDLTYNIKKQTHFKNFIIEFNKA